MLKGYESDIPACRFEAAYISICSSSRPSLFQRLPQNNLSISMSSSSTPTIGTRVISSSLSLTLSVSHSYGVIERLPWVSGYLLLPQLVVYLPGQQVVVRTCKFREPRLPFPTEKTKAQENLSRSSFSTSIAVLPCHLVWLSAIERAQQGIGHQNGHIVARRLHDAHHSGARWYWRCSYKYKKVKR